jgi:hypothetical protein
MRRAYFARSLGRLLIISAVAVALTAFVQQFLSPVIMVISVVASTTLLVLAALAAVSLMLPPTLLQLDDRGFRALRRQTAGPASAPWDRVKRVGTQTVDDEPVLTVEHADGGITAVPLALLDEPAEAVEADVQRRLDRAHGYRRLS